MTIFRQRLRRDWILILKAERQLPVSNPPILNPQSPKIEILNRAIELEGHGDNVAPAYLGGMIVVSPKSGPNDASGSHYITHRVNIKPQKAVVCVPDFHFLTSTARAAVPQQFSRSDMIFNIGRAMLVVEALRDAEHVFRRGRPAQAVQAEGTGRYVYRVSGSTVEGGRAGAFIAVAFRLGGQLAG